MHRIGHANYLRWEALAAVLPLLLLLDGAAAQDKKKPAAPPAAQEHANAPAASAAAPKVVMPDAERIVLLTRTTLLTLNDALRTGNFTVLRDVAAPGFREANSAARLSAIFANLLAQRIDLTPVAVLTPQLSGPPILDEKSGMMRIKGHFPGQPVRIDFDVIYQAVGGQWRLFGLSVQPTAAVAAAAPAAGKPANPPAQKAAPPKKK